MSDEATYSEVYLGTTFLIFIAANLVHSEFVAIMLYGLATFRGLVSLWRLK